MNKTQAMAKCNPQSVHYDDPKVDGGGDFRMDASYSEALGFVSSCHGVSALSHYSLIPGLDTVSRRSCAREVRKELSLILSVPEIEEMIEIFVNRQEVEIMANIRHIDERVFRLLNEWEMEWQRKLGDTDREPLID